VATTRLPYLANYPYGKKLMLIRILVEGCMELTCSHEFLKRLDEDMKHVLYQLAINIFMYVMVGTKSHNSFIVATH
jgi:hypothetical protein